jgi:hypothetical protein
VTRQTLTEADLPPSVLTEAEGDARYAPVAVVGVPPGGATGQALTKTTGADYATGWASPWVQMTQAAYDALPTKDPNVLYVIVG